MAEYYLVSQLPSLDGIGENTPIPITEEQFLELCAANLDTKAFERVRLLTLVPSIDAVSSGSWLIDSWNEGERRLRIALGRARAERMNKAFSLQSGTTDPELARVVTAALGASDPLKAEKILLDYRLSLLETLRPIDTFSVDYIYYYALKLKLIMRVRGFDTALGEKEYKNIYSAVSDGRKVEA